jgi:GxxExxY protein
MNRNEHESEKECLDAVVEKAIGAAYEVSNTLGAGFLEKVYERALIRELALRGSAVRSRVSVLRRL